MSTIANELYTLRDVLRWTTSQFNRANLFYGHGNTDAFNDALQLILFSLNLPVTEFPEVFADARLTLEEKNDIAELVNRRITEHMPVPYLTNEAWFAGMPFYVDERVLIPRSPFAEIILEQFSPWIQNPKSVYKILDLCTGSGCIAIALAMEFPNASVDAVDISQDALDVAQINISKHYLKEHVHTVHSDLWHGLKGKKYDLITSNPPYVGRAEMSTLPAEYLNEPKLALEAKDNGLAIVERIIFQAAEYLTLKGLLFVEVGNSDFAVIERWPDIDFLWLDFNEGGHGIFMLTQKQCAAIAKLS